MPTYFGSLHLDAMRAVVYTSVPWLVATLTDLLIGGWLVDHLIRRGYKETFVRQTVLILRDRSRPCPCRRHVHERRGNGSDLDQYRHRRTRRGRARRLVDSIADCTPQQRGKIGGILNTGNQIAGALAPIVTGWLVSRTNSFGAAFAVAAAVIVIGVAAYLVLLGPIEQLPEPTRE